MTEQKSRNRTRTTGGAAAGKPQEAAARPTGAGKTTGRARSAARPAAARAGATSSAGRTTGAASAPATTSSAGALGAATIRFLPDWREEVTGDVRPGGRLRVEYAVERLPGNGAAPAARAQGVVAEVRFVPGGQHHTGRVTGGKFEVAVPSDASEVMIWFYRTDGGATSWDSRFGENYRFSIGARTAGGQTKARATNRRPASAA
ncbi:MAG TPA: DUF6209 family protein [Chloroflexota bacterium]|jgi:hypothetical protein